MSQNAGSTEHRDAEIEKLTSELDAANKELESLSYAVSHDLRAPLRAIEGFSDVIVEDYKDKLDAEGQRYLGIIRASSIKASKMVEGLLTYSRLGRHHMTFSEVNNDEMVQGVITDLRKLIGNGQIEFDLQPLPIVRGDFFLLREIWKALLANSIKFTRKNPSPKISVRCVDEKDTHVFTIQDNGVGFDMKYSEKLFQLFQRLHSESDFEGIGVGLAIAQRLVHRHGGKMWADSKPGEGAVFHFSLPK